MRVCSHTKAHLFIVYFRVYVHSTLYDSILSVNNLILVLQLAIQLAYAYNQILSVLTNTQLQQIFEKSPGFDLRHLLQGSEKFVDNILNMTDTDPSLIFAGVSHVHVCSIMLETPTTSCTRHSFAICTLVHVHMYLYVLKPLHVNDI